MSYTVYANGRSVCTKGTPDTAHADADPCETKDDEVIEPPNDAPLENLGTGQTATVMIAGQPVWTANGQLDPDTNPEHDGTKGGVDSGTYRGWCQPTSYSPDVIFENGGVVRMDDTTIQNSGNCEGIVMPAVEAAAASAAALKAAKAALAALRKNKNDSPDGSEDPDGADKTGADQTGKDTDGDGEGEEDCSIVSARLEDSDGRGLDNSGTLEIVPKGSETITCTGEIEGICATGKEAKWKASGNHKHDATAVSTSFTATHWSLGHGWIGDCAARSTNVTFQGGDNTKSFTLKTYPDDFERITLKIPEAITALVKGAEVVLNKATTAKVSVKGPVLSLVFQGEWKEDSASTSAFYKYSIKGGGWPLLAVTGQFPLLPNPAMAWLLDKIGIGLYLDLEGGSRLTVDITRDTPGAPQLQCQASGYFKITVSFKAEMAGKHVGGVQLGIFGKGVLSGTAKKVGDAPGIEVGLTVEAQGFVKAKICSFLEYEKRATVIEKKSILGDPPPFIDLTQCLS